MISAAREPMVLALDSAGAGCSVVVAAGEKVLAAEQCATERGQAEKLLPMVDAAIQKSGLCKSALDLVATTIGPGSFTGIRVGLAAASGIALATGARAVGVTAFEAVVANLAPWTYERRSGFLLVALESRREDLYIQLFDHTYRPIGDPTIAMPTALDEALHGLIGAAFLVIAGDAARRAANMFLRRSLTKVIEGSAPDATGVLQAVLRGAGQRYRPLLPLYLRPPDVTISTGTKGPVGEMSS
jgi:tRNA threonylcarbamoyladenosine biosynthesis protein TsaB